VYSEATVTSLDGREFKLTPENLTIERQTFKQSSKSPTSSPLSIII
jgi:hypothetical protein